VTVDRDPRPLRLCIVGLGRMGRAVERVAVARGHSVAHRVDPCGGDCAGPESIDASSVDVSMEFTTPEAALRNVLALIERGTPVVSGTTGWDDRIDEARAAARDAGVGFLWSPNFSLGMQLLFRLAALTSGWMGRLDGFAPFVEERHHAGKRDSPSGSAARLAALVVASSPGKREFGAAPDDGPIPAERVAVASIRAGSIPGDHTVGWDGPFETLELSHRVRDRAVFAEGAVRAAEWLAGRDSPHDIEEMLEDLLPGF